MTRPTREAWSQWWGGNEPDAIAEEILGSGAIADLVGCRFDALSLTERRKHKSAPLLEWAPVGCIGACHTEPHTCRELAEILGYSVSHVRQAVRQAVAEGALRREGTLILPTTWRPAAKCLISVELKLRDWRRALRQAESYGDWSDKVWIVMGQSVPDPLIEACRQSGFGLALLTHSFDILVEPTLREPDPWHPARLLAGEQIIAQVRP